MILSNLLRAILWPLTPAVEIVAILRLFLGWAAKGFAGPHPRSALVGLAGVQFVWDRGSSPLAAITAAAASIPNDSVRRDSASSATTIPDDNSVWTTIPHRGRRRFFAKISRRFF